MDSDQTEALITFGFGAFAGGLVVATAMSTLISLTVALLFMLQ